MSDGKTGRSAGMRGLAGRIVLAAVLGMAPAAAGANDLSPFAGRWDSASTDCNHPQGDGVFVVEPGTLRFFESICEVGSVRPTGVGNAVTGRMSCEGEGESWTEELIIARSEEDQLHVYFGAGYGFIAGRCGP